MSEDSTDDLIESKNAVKNYLDSLLACQPPKAESAPITPEQVTTEGGQVPAWAKNGFSALYFRSAGLHLYVPVSFVRGIKNVGGTIESLPQAASWIKGCISFKNTTITVVDTEKLLIPNKRRTVAYQHPDQNAYVILLGSGDFGLSCDTIGQVKQVAANEVHWRAKNQRKQFISGMFKSEVAALIDARRIALTVSMDGTLV